MKREEEEEEERLLSVNVVGLTSRVCEMTADGCSFVYEEISKKKSSSVKEVVGSGGWGQRRELNVLKSLHVC